MAASRGLSAVATVDADDRACAPDDPDLQRVAYRASLEVISRSLGASLLEFLR